MPATKEGESVSSLLSLAGKNEKKGNLYKASVLYERAYNKTHDSKYKSHGRYLVKELAKQKRDVEVVTALLDRGEAREAYGYTKKLEKERPGNAAQCYLVLGLEDDARRSGAHALLSGDYEGAKIIAAAFEKQEYAKAGLLEKKQQPQAEESAE